MIAQWSSGEKVLVEKSNELWRSNENFYITNEQWDKLEILQERHGLSDPVEVLPGFGYIGVMVGSMFIGIEADGYSHT